MWAAHSNDPRAAKTLRFSGGVAPNVLEGAGESADRANRSARGTASRGAMGYLSLRNVAMRHVALGVGVMLLLAAWPVSSLAQIALTTVAAGANPGPVVLNPITNRIYVASFQNGTVKVIDGATAALIATLDVASPGAIAVNTTTNMIYVADTSANTVTVINGATNTAGTPITVGTSPVAVAVNPVTNMIYVANQGSNNVSVIDGSSNTVAATPLTGASPQAIAVNPTTNLTYVVNNAAATVSVIDGTASPQSVIATVNVGSNPSSIGVNPATNFIYVANSGSNTVTVINGTFNTTASTATVPTDLQPRALTVNPVSDKIYVANYNSSTVTVIDGFLNNTVTVNVGLAPVAVAVNPTTNQVYVANNGSGSEAGTLSVIDGTLNDSASVVTVPLASGAFPVSVAVNPVTNQVYTADQSSSDVTVFDGATNVTATVATGSSSQTNGSSIAANPATNRIYVPNSFSNTVTVIDGTNNTTNTITTGIGMIPNNPAVNVVTNKIYVTNLGGGTVSVIDGSTDTVSDVVTVGFSSQTNRTSIAVNPVTNKIYVPNSFSNTVTVIDGFDDTTTTITTGIGTIPNAVAINPVTNKIYVTNLADGTVSVIDGFTDTVSAVVTVGFSSQTNGSSIAVNPATNKIYVPNSFSNTVTVINGATNATTTISAQIGSISNNLAINPVTNKIYVTNLGDGTVSVIDGSTDTVGAVVTVGFSSQTNRTSIAVNPVTDKIYVPNSFSNTVTVIDGATNTTRTVTPGQISNAVAINLATNNIYVTNLQDATVTVISEEQVQAIPLTTTIASIPGNVTRTSTPTFTFTAMNNFPSPIPPINGLHKTATPAFINTPAIGSSFGIVTNVYYQVDTWEGPWIAATPGSGNFTGTSTVLRQGTHVVYAFATDGEESHSTGMTQQLVGQISAEVFTVILPGTFTDLNVDNNPAGVGQPVTFTADVGSKASGTITGTVTFFDGATSLGSGALVSGEATLTTSALTLGSHSITAVYGGDANFSGGTSKVLTEVIAASNPVPVATSLSPTFATAGGATFTLTVNGSGFVSGSTVMWNGVALTTTFVSTTQLTASVPASDVLNAGTVPVTVFSPALGGGTSNALTFTINNPVPVLTSISPTTAVGGGPSFTLTVNGSNFVSGSVVKWGGAARTTTFVSSTQLTASIPSSDLLSSGSVGVLVFNPLPGGGNSVNVATFTITVPVPVLTTIAPSSAAAGSPGFTMTLTGTTFISTSVARWNGVDLATTFVSATQLTAVVPAADLLTVGTASVTVFNPTGVAQVVKAKVHPLGGGPSGQLSNALTFTITAANPTPVVASLSPSAASAGGAAFTLTVTGSGFVSGAIVQWNGMSLVTTFVSATQLTAVVPAGDITAAGTASVTVFNPTPGGGVSNAVTETISTVTTTATVVVTPTPPIAGQPITFTVTIAPPPTGSSLGTVSIFNGATLLGTANVNSSGVATFTTSALAAGSYSITAVYSGNASSGTSTSAVIPITVSVAASFSVTAPQTPFVLAQGGSVSIPIMVPPVGGPFNSAVTMSATGLPPGATASFAPPVVTPGTAGATTVLTIQLATSAGSVAPMARVPQAPQRPFPIFPAATLTLALITLGFLITYRRPRAIRLAFATVAFAGAVILFAGCNGGFSGGQRTTPGNYTVTVTGTSGAQHVSTTVTLAVQR